MTDNTQKYKDYIQHTIISRLERMMDVTNGFKELGSDNLKTYITIKFNSMSDAEEKLQMSASDIRAHNFELQRRLYRA